MPLHVIVTNDFEQMSTVAAEFIRTRLFQTLAGRGFATLGLATGRSPTGVYRHLALAVNRHELDATKIRSFNLDDYVGLPGADAQDRARHPESCASCMDREFFGRLQTKFSEVHIPSASLIDSRTLELELRAHPENWQEQGAGKGKAIVIRPDATSDYLRWVRRDILDAYEQKIQAAGGIDLHLIGVGGRGHVAFHESGIPFAGNRMLLVRLDDSTVEHAVIDGHFARKEDSPRYAISMGAGLVYEARCVVLLASGSRKAEPIAASLAEDPTDAVPISYGQTYAKRGGKLLYVIDREAAAGVLARRNEIEARGIVIQDRSAPRTK